MGPSPLVAYPETVGKTSILVKLMAALVALPAVASAEEPAYGGVNPESETAENLPPKAEEIPEDAVMLTWPGFLMQEDGSTFFVQTSKEVRFGTQKSEGRLELMIYNIRVHLKTNYLPLETQYFDTPVTRATVQRAGKGVRVVFEMREDALPTVTQKKGKDGFNYVYVKFPK